MKIICDNQANAFKLGEANFDNWQYYEIIAHDYQDGKFSYIIHYFSDNNNKVLIAHEDDNQNVLNYIIFNHNFKFDKFKINIDFKRQGTCKFTAYRKALNNYNLWR